MENIPFRLMLGYQYWQTAIESKIIPINKLYLIDRFYWTLIHLSTKRIVKFYMGKIEMLYTVYFELGFVFISLLGEKLFKSSNFVIKFDAPFQ